MKAILSDIHGNLEALMAVLGDIAGQGVDSIVNLGDITGYGPDPVGCLELSMMMRLVLKGNFDLAVVEGVEKFGFGVMAEESIVWTRNLLRSPDSGSKVAQRGLAYLAGLPESHSEGEVLYVRGSPYDHVHEFVFPECVHNPSTMERVSRPIEHLCFNGHTHVPGIFVESGEDGWQFFRPEECGDGFRVDDRKVLCNVGAVGQPRDGDWRACYVLFDGETISFRRVEYDVEATIAKIYGVPELHNFAGDRLRSGR